MATEKLRNPEIALAYVEGHSRHPDLGYAIATLYKTLAARIDKLEQPAEAAGCHHSASNYQLDGDTGHVWCFSCKPPRRLTLGEGGWPIHEWAKGPPAEQGEAGNCIRCGEEDTTPKSDRGAQRVSSS